ncbi:MAG: SH3 domain-containing protein, partial [Chloroflexota bacterium]|nr:SH3 domain-containing protein [Chloroflexota bacterium]
MSPVSSFPAVRRIRAVQVALALLIAISMALPIFSAPTPAAAAGAYTTTALNLRAGPSTSNHIKLTMPEGAYVELMSGLGNAGFYKVSYNGELGYAWGEYLSVGEEIGFEPGDVAGGTAWTTDSLNLRTGPSTGHGIHLVMPPGAEVQLTGAVDGGFSGVVYAGVIGWASNDYLTDGDDGGGALDPGDGDAGTLHVISALNLRTGPGLSH